MIVDYSELERHKKGVVMVDGCFDPLHEGHLKYFEVARSLGWPLLCNVQSDEYIRNRKRRPVVLPAQQRVKLIDSIEHVSYVHLCQTSTADVLERLKPAKYVKGMDWLKRGLPEKEKEVCSNYGIDIVYLDTNIGSSTNVVEKFVKELNTMNNDINEFEKILFGQKEIEPQHYDEHYFQGNWREGANDYSIERRREIEAKNPMNIKEVFKPRRVLDVGCGPGALMYFLYELGIEPYGIDFSAAAKELAPEEIRDNIVVAPVTEYHDFGMEFDLVICRELLEHLTVLQIKKAVKVLADYTSKYLYVTTRFHPSPKGLLDVTDDRETDPTHITLLNKDFLKLMFMLEGLKPRPDLEDRMDWKKLGRVLVFEKV